MEPTQPKSDCAKEPMQPKFGCAEESPNDDQETDTAGNGGHGRSSGPQLEKSSSATQCGRRNSGPQSEKSSVATPCGRRNSGPQSEGKDSDEQRSSVSGRQLAHKTSVTERSSGPHSPHSEKSGPQLEKS